MAYSIAVAMQKGLGVQTLVTAETKKYLSEYFDVDEEIPVLEERFCDWREVHFEVFEGGIDELLANEALRKGRLLTLWPRGYKVSQPLNLGERL